MRIVKLSIGAVLIATQISGGPMDKGRRVSGLHTQIWPALLWPWNALVLVSIVVWMIGRLQTLVRQGIMKAVGRI